MRLAPFYLSFAFISSGQVFAQNAVVDWFPTHAGDKRIYDHETRDDTGKGPAHAEVHRWKTEETIIGSWTVPEGTLVGGQVRVLDGSPPVGYRVNPDPAFLIHGDCLYRLSAHDWDRSAHQLTPEFRKWFAVGEISADFCFPLTAHKTWGAPNWGGIRPASEAKDWEVAGMKARDQSAPDKQKTVHITSVSSYLGSGMTADIWFEKGVGIVREAEVHHGTIGEERTHLVRFQPVCRLPLAGHRPETAVLETVVNAAY
jgi:hypothetical protein